MKHLKMLGLLVVVAAALLAVAGSASGAVLTSPAGAEYTGEMHATLATPDSALLRAGIEDTCGESTVKGIVEANTQTTASGNISALSFGDCTKTTHVLKTGSLSIASGGVVTASGTEVTIMDLGISCVYGPDPGVNLGTLAGGSPAVLAVATNVTKRTGGFLCKETGTWTAKYTVTTPATLLVD